MKYTKIFKYSNTFSNTIKYTNMYMFILMFKLLKVNCIEVLPKIFYNSIMLTYFIQFRFYII